MELKRGRRQGAKPFKYIHIQMNFTMEVLRMGWLLPPYGLFAEVHDSTNSADNPYRGEAHLK